MSIIPAIIVHGGAGAISQSRELPKKIGVKKAVQAGYKVLLEEGNVLDAVEIAVKIMEDDEAFNAGYGSVLTVTGDVEMDAIIIEGSSLLAGGVGAVKHVKNPICLARKVMSTDHSLLVGSGAEEFARSVGIPLVPSSELISPFALSTLKDIVENSAKATTELGDQKGTGSGTVGAVAINSRGEMAAATSTGGIFAKLPGRVGDTPIIGGGTYCDNVCGISATGLGEAIMRVCLSSRIANAIERGTSISEACKEALAYMTGKIPESDGGAIAITKDGKLGYDFNSEKMAWGYTQGGTIHYGVVKDEHIVEELQ